MNKKHIVIPPEVIEIVDNALEEWNREHNSTGFIYSRTTMIRYGLAVLAEHPDLLIQLAVAAKALVWYSICSEHLERQGDCERCNLGSYGVAGHEGRWVQEFGFEKKEK